MTRDSLVFLAFAGLAVWFLGRAAWHVSLADGQAHLSDIGLGALSAFNALARLRIIELRKR